MVEKIHTTHVTDWDHDKKFTRVVSSVTIELLREVGVPHWIIRGVYWKSSGYVFKDYMEHQNNMSSYNVLYRPPQFLLRGSNGGGSGGSSSSGSGGGGNGDENYYGEMVYQKQLRRQRTLSPPLNTDIDKVANKLMLVKSSSSPAQWRILGLHSGGMFVTSNDQHYTNVASLI
ncbi:hypothetical protein K457DRAFT_19610 [Linnemannia elongata AG-77]|uniref:Uncharacterized protein n=1 Tax=Linnemannia elongata AG-77 TaxID=1314771 RepID=A0A197JWW5_9FUNG|nr:hypothetical protein K457DRAFT_19610 [Linnemannia elongata AG-77]